MKKLLPLIIFSLFAFSANAKYGDVNNDGVVTSYDITALYNYLLNGDETFLSTSDVNGDGIITAYDISCIYNVLLNDSGNNCDGLFRRCYGTMATSGTHGADSNVDISFLDGGYQSFYRQLWNSNELTTDEAICGWSDSGIYPLDFNYYTEKNPMLMGYFYRLYYSIFLCNTYLDDYKYYNVQKTAEVRFLRALYYYFAMDAFGNIPSYTESANDSNSYYVTAGDGSYTYPVWRWYPQKPQFKTQMSRAQMFAFIENELIEAEKGMAPPTPKNSSHEMYWRADKAAAWLLLSRLYLNAQVYTGTPRWSEARTYAKKVMDSDYQLFSDGYDGNGIDGMHRNFSAYQMLFMGDNGETDASKEAILIIPHNGDDTFYTSYGTSTFLICSTFDGDMHPYSYDNSEVNGLYNNNTWGGNRCRPELIKKFFCGIEAPDGHAYDVVAAAGDDRAIFETYFRSLNVDNVSSFWSGYATAKFNNFKTDGSQGSDPQFPDMDIFLLRKAEAYLTYAEAVTRLAGSGAAPADAVSAINALRARAHATEKASYSLNDILDEWSREFYFEGRRRVDLIRFGKYGGTTDYQWQWKGDTYAGRDFMSFRNVFAIPQSIIAENPSIIQNNGYNPYDHDVVIENAMNISVSSDVQNLYTIFTCNDISAVLAQIPDAKASIIISADSNFYNNLSFDCSINTTTSSMMAQVKNSAVNDWIINNSLSDGSDSMTLYAKVVCSGDKCGDNYFKSAISNTVQWSIKVNTIIIPKLWYMVGNCVGSNDWDNSASSIGTGLIPLLPEPGATFNAYGQGTLVYAGYFPAGGQFKFIKTPGSWDEQMNFTNINSNEAGVTDEDGDNHNIGIPEDGFYYIEMNTVNKTISIEKLAGTYAEFTTITLPGAYQAWNPANNAMTAMGKRVNTQNHEWYLDATFGTDTEVHFTNGSWDVNWGATTFPYGYGSQGGPNIPVNAGTYRVYFNDILGLYAFIGTYSPEEGENNEYLNVQALDEIVDLTETFSNSDKVKVCSLTTNMGEYNYPQLSITFDDGTRIPIDYDGKVNANQLKNYVSSLIGDVSKVGFKSLKFVVMAQISNTQHICSNSATVGLLLDNYYIRTANGDLSLMKFDEPGKYSIMIPAQDITFFFMPASKLSDVTENRLGSNEETDGFIFGGRLAQGAAAHEIWLDEDPDYTQYIISINLNDMTYDVQGLAFADMIWQAGNANGWGNPASGLKNKGWKYAQNNDGDYYGFMYLDGDFMFRSYETTWDATIWGAGNSEGSLMEFGGTLSATEGFYLVEANIGYLTYNLIPITTVGVIGSFNGWASDYAKLTYNPATRAWEGYCDIPDGAEFKFRANDDWTINFGGDINNLNYDGSNIKLDSDGNYFIRLYLTYKGGFHATFTKQ